MSAASRKIETIDTPDGVLVAGAIGRARVAQLSATVVRIDIEGHAYTEFATLLQRPLDALLRARRRLFVGVDAEGMHSYESRFRYLWTEWLKANGDTLDDMLVLFRSRIIESAVVVINAVMGRTQVTACRDRERFETALADAVVRSRSVELGDERPHSDERSPRRRD